MDMSKKCPTCGTKFVLDVKHEWPRVDGRRQLDLVLTSQSVNTDDGKLESLLPYADDGQELVISGERLNDREIVLHISRKPRPQSQAAPAAGAAPMPKAAKSRRDLETEAAEAGLRVDKKWTDDQLRVALEKHKAEATA